LRILKLKEILKSGKFTSKELAEKLKASVNSVRNYLKEIGIEKNRKGF
jgi:DNA-binding CsgD family transcriptional regulator